jgi:hypothetical protein
VAATRRRGFGVHPRLTGKEGGRLCLSGGHPRTPHTIFLPHNSPPSNSNSNCQYNRSRSTSSSTARRHLAHSFVASSPSSIGNAFTSNPGRSPAPFSAQCSPPPLLPANRSGPLTPSSPTSPTRALPPGRPRACWRLDPPVPVPWQIASSPFSKPRR